ncbi:MAG: phospholipase, partial [Actinomycetota bacterium]|nr:phospholipase [Actinomycetota bacterium]
MHTLRGSPRAQERDTDHPLPVSRRKFMQRSAIAAAGGVLFSCTGGKVIPRVGPSSSPAMSADTQWPIKRVIYVMLENRSFDNVFGRFPGVDGARTGLLLGKERPLVRCPDWLPGDLPHDRVSAIACLNNGAQDNFG